LTLIRSAAEEFSGASARLRHLCWIWNASCRWSRHQAPVPWMVQPMNLLALLVRTVWTGVGSGA
ncbi:MAG: hypothetical protein ACRYHQ_30055, partial [Janthinobacterium lividum]